MKIASGARVSKMKDRLPLTPKKFLNATVICSFALNGRVSGGKVKDSPLEDCSTVFNLLKST